MNDQIVSQPVDVVIPGQLEKLPTVKTPEVAEGTHVQTEAHVGKEVLAQEAN